jgi:hypothetical protein
MFRPIRLRDKYLSMAARKFKRRAYLFGLIAVLIFFTLAILAEYQERAVV